MKKKDQEKDKKLENFPSNKESKKEGDNNLTNRTKDFELLQSSLEDWNYRNDAMENTVEYEEPGLILDDVQMYATSLEQNLDLHSELRDKLHTINNSISNVIERELFDDNDFDIKIKPELEDFIKKYCEELESEKLELNKILLISENKKDIDKINEQISKINLALNPPLDDNFDDEDYYSKNEIPELNPSKKDQFDKIFRKTPTTRKIISWGIAPSSEWYLENEKGGYEGYQHALARMTVIDNKNEKTYEISDFRFENTAQMKYLLNKLVPFADKNNKQIMIPEYNYEYNSSITKFEQETILKETGFNLDMNYFSNVKSFLKKPDNLEYLKSRKLVDMSYYK